MNWNLEGTVWGKGRLVSTGSFTLGLDLKYGEAHSFPLNWEESYLLSDFAQNIFKVLFWSALSQLQ